MAKYRMMGSFGRAGDDTDFGIEEFDSEEDAAQAAWDFAVERVDAWAEIVEDDEE